MQLAKLLNNLYLIQCWSHAAAFVTSPPLREGVAEELVSALKVSFEDTIDFSLMMVITFYVLKVRSILSDHENGLNVNTTTTITSLIMGFLQDGEGLDLVSSDHTGISQAQRAAGQENFTAIPQVGRLDDCDHDSNDYVIESW